MFEARKCAFLLGRHVPLFLSQAGAFGTDGRATGLQLAIVATFAAFVLPMCIDKMRHVSVITHLRTYII